MIENLEVSEWLKYNSQLQKKKNALRKVLKERGVLKREGRNEFGKGYSYFSEAQYKELFTELFSEHGLELNFTELEYNLFQGSDKQPNGRYPKLEFRLIDIDTGFYESTIITGEGMDVGDKAGYKAYTGALKYFLANNFMVATGDDPEKDSPASTMNAEKKASAKQIEYLAKVYQGDNLTKLLEIQGIARLEDITMKKASELIAQLKGGKK